MQSGLAASLIILMLAPAAVAPEPAEIVPEAVVDGDPVVAEQAPSVGAPPGPQNAPDDALLKLQPATTRLFNALKGGAADEEVEKLVSATASELDMNCPRVKEYQVYRATTRARTLKIKCVERPVYAVTVGPSGEGFVSGGDGTISPMRISDGPIKAVMGLRIEEYVANEGQESSANDNAEGDTAVPGFAEHQGRNWLILIAKLTGIALVLAALGYAYREMQRQKRSYSRWRGLDSEAKDQMIEESEEIYPDLYRHSSGVFIARGRRGKRRLFPTLVFAYLYSSRSIKLFEIR